MAFFLKSFQKCFHPPPFLKLKPGEPFETLPSFLWKPRQVYSVAMERTVKFYSSSSCLNFHSRFVERFSNPLAHQNFGGKGTFFSDHNVFRNFLHIKGNQKKLYDDLVGWLHMRNATATTLGNACESSCFLHNKKLLDEGKVFHTYFHAFLRGFLFVFCFYFSTNYAFAQDAISVVQIKNSHNCSDECVIFDGLEVAARQHDSNEPIEDRFIISKAELPNEQGALVTVIDGHGGPATAEYVMQNITRHQQEQLQKMLHQAVTYKEIFVTAFNNLDDELEENIRNELISGSFPHVKIGAACLSVLVTSSSIVTANAGDCKAVLCRDGKAVPLSFEHTSNSTIEQNKLRKKHPGEDDVVKCKNSWYELLRPGEEEDEASEKQNRIDFFGKSFVKKHSACYVKSRLQPTRGFGDFFLKYEKYSFDPKNNKLLVAKPHSFPYITVTPDVKVFPKTERDEFIIIASDGFWDNFCNQEAVNLISEIVKTSTKDAAEKLIYETLKLVSQKRGVPVPDFRRMDPATRRRYHDDITVCVIRFNKKKETLFHRSNL